MDSRADTPEGVGCPIRTCADQRSLATPRALSQRATSFIASWRQGIHRTPFSRARDRFRRRRQSAAPTPARTTLTRSHTLPLAASRHGSHHPWTPYRPDPPSPCQRATRVSGTPSRPHRPDPAGTPGQPGTRPAERLVEAIGFEPTTPCLQSRRSPAELRPRRPDLRGLHHRERVPCGTTPAAAAPRLAALLRTAATGFVSLRRISPFAAAEVGNGPGRP